MEYAVFETLDAVFETYLAVLVPKKARVGEPRPQDAFVAGNDRSPAVGSQIVGDKQKARCRGAVGLQTGKVFLMGAHRRRQHLRRKRHKIRVDRPLQHYRELDKAGDFLEQ